MKKIFENAVLILLFATLLAACNSAPAPVSTPVRPTSLLPAPTAVVNSTAVPLNPTATTPKPTAVPLNVASPTLPKPTTPVATYEGDWSGTSDPNALPFNFTIKGNKITQANINWSIKVGSCSVGGGFADSPSDSSQSGKSISAQLANSGLTFNLQGTFTSDTEASGTIEWKGKHEFCGEVPPTQVKWSAKKTPASATTDSNPEPSPSPKSQVASKPDAEILKSFFEAVNAKKFDDALDLVDDNLIFTFGSTSGIGSDSLRDYLSSATKAGTIYQLSNVQSNPARVTFTAQAGNTKFSGSAMFQDGMIVILQLQ